MPILWTPTEVGKPCAMIEIFSMSEIARHVKIVTMHIVWKGGLAERTVSRLSQL